MKSLADYPVAGVIVDSKGNLYGDTELGGASNLGAVYELSKGTLTLLHSFAGSDGEDPFGGLIQDAKGSLYGTTQGGGSSQNCRGGCGTVFKLTP